MFEVTIHHYHHIVPAPPGDSKLLEEIVARLVGLENHMSQQDEKIAAFEAAANTKLAALGAAIGNISADEAKILADLQVINTNQELTPENQAKLDAVLDSLSTAVDKSQALADSLPDGPPAPQ